MAKAVKPNKVEAAQAVSAPQYPCCGNCKFSKMQGVDLLCDISLPRSVPRSERYQDYIVSRSRVCDLHKRKD